jgi:hypothetical protein
MIKMKLFLQKSRFVVFLYYFSSIKLYVYQLKISLLYILYACIELSKPKTDPSASPPRIALRFPSTPSFERPFFSFSLHNGSSFSPSPSTLYKRTRVVSNRSFESRQSSSMAGRRPSHFFKIILPSTIDDKKLVMHSPYLACFLLVLL